MRFRSLCLALASLCLLQGAAQAARLNKCVGGIPWYRGSTTASDIRGFGEFYRRPDGSMYFVRGGNIQDKHTVDAACFRKVKNPPPVYDAQQ